MIYITIAILGLTAWIFSFLASIAVMKLLPKFSVVDVPVDRSNHVLPTPRGGGIAVIFGALSFMFVAGFKWQMLFAALVLAGVSFLDDVKGVSASKRLLIHFVTAFYAGSVLDGLVFQGMFPLLADRIALAVLWTAYMNMFNFMDGIDEISAVETFGITAGIIAIFISANGLPLWLPVDAFIVACATLGFWFFNRHPAKLFLGDVGSISLGFLTGYILIHLALHGYWAAALILPAYYMVDAGLTLTLRLLKGQKIWEAHSEHAYQKAVRAWGNHREVVSHILMLNMLLVVLAVVSTVSEAYAMMALQAAYFLALLWWFYLRSAKKRIQTEVIPPVMAITQV